MVGTLNYMSPEQLQETDEGSRSAKVGKWTDSWSLGCILYLMAYQKLPFEEFKSTPMKVTKIIDENYQISFPPHSCPGLGEVFLFENYILIFNFSGDAENMPGPKPEETNDAV